MLFDRIVGNVLDPDLPQGAGEADSVNLLWNQCFRRAQSVTTSAGKKIRILLPLGVSMRHGDVIFNGESRVIVQVLMCEVLVVRPANLRQAVLVALALGNLHAPVQCDGDLLITLPDGPIEEALAALDAMYEKQQRRFAPTTVATPIRAQLASDFQLWTSGGKAAVPAP